MQNNIEKIPHISSISKRLHLKGTFPNSLVKKKIPLLCLVTYE